MINFEGWRKKRSSFVGYLEWERRVFGEEDGGRTAVFWNFSQIVFLKLHSKLKLKLSAKCSDFHRNFPINLNKFSRELERCSKDDFAIDGLTQVVNNLTSLV
jgi:hypothetical protein